MIKVWFSFVVLTLVQGYPTCDLLDSVDCLLRDCERYLPNAERNMAENVIVRLEVAKLNRTIHPFYVKSKWIPAPVQQSVALESYLEEVKLQLAEIKITKPKQ